MVLKTNTSQDKPSQRFKKIVLERLKQGYTKDQIKKDALTASWPKTIVTQVLNEIGNDFEEQKSVLSEAINELNKELKKLKLEKTRLESELLEKEEEYQETQKKETEYRTKVDTLITNEKRLNNEKEKLKEELVLLKEKLDKVTKISNELNSI